MYAMAVAENATICHAIGVLLYVLYVVRYAPSRLLQACGYTHGLTTTWLHACGYMCLQVPCSLLVEQCPRF
jgi:hypothetical protein